MIPLPHPPPHTHTHTHTHITTHSDKCPDVGPSDKDWWAYCKPYAPPAETEQYLSSDQHKNCCLHALSSYVSQLPTRHAH